MELTKIGTGQFSGKVGNIAKLTILERDNAGVLVQMISAVYGAKILTPISNTVSVPLAAGMVPLTIVYAASKAGGWIDLFEVDASGQQKLRANVFNPAEPTIHIGLNGAS